MLRIYNIKHKYLNICIEILLKVFMCHIIHKGTTYVSEHIACVYLYYCMFNPVNSNTSKTITYFIIVINVYVTYTQHTHTNRMKYFNFLITLFKTKFSTHNIMLTFYSFFYILLLLFH